MLGRHRHGRGHGHGHHGVRGAGVLRVESPPSVRTVRPRMRERGPRRVQLLAAGTGTEERDPACERDQSDVVFIGGDGSSTSGVQSARRPGALCSRWRACGGRGTFPVFAFCGSVPSRALTRSGETPVRPWGRRRPEQERQHDGIIYENPHSEGHCIT